LLKDEFNFDSDIKLMAAIEKVNKERLLACFRDIVFQNPRRINMKIHSHTHRDDTETRKMSQALNKAFYTREDLFGSEPLKFEIIDSIRKFQRSHPLHPRL